MSYAAIRAKIIETGVVTADEAADMFKDLYRISLDRCRELCGPVFKDDFPTKQYRGPGGFSEAPNGWHAGDPIGVTDHFTADNSVVGTLRWFSSHQWPQPDGTKKRAGASAAFVVDLTGEAFLLIPFWDGKSDWAEPQTNGWCLGIEHVNAGELRRQPDGSWTTWPNGWKKPYTLAASLPPQPVLDWRGARYMQPFTREQLLTNLVIKRGLIAMYPGKIRPDLMADHATYREDKTDMGPLWPLAKLREAAFSMAPLNSFSFLSQHVHVEGADYDAIDATDLMAINATAIDSQLPRELDDSPIEKSGVLWVQLSLKQLGYDVIANGLPTKDYADAVRKFQTDQGLSVDGVAGRMTRKLIATMMAAPRK